MLNFLSFSTQIAQFRDCLSVVFLVIAYLIGSIPFGVVIGKKFKGIDIREHGSKNIGSTNAIRVLGKKLGYVVFFFDVLKGAFVILLLMLLEALGLNLVSIDLLYFGVAAILGHVFPIYCGFKGGKAVATSLGVVLVLAPLPAILCLVVFLIILYTTGYVSLASTGATATVLITGWTLFAVGTEESGFWNYFIHKTSLAICILFSIIGVLIIVKHFKNYKRLLNGTENNFKKKKKA